MRQIVIALGAALVLAPAVASAQSAAENFSYTTASGMFGEGYAKWQLYRFIHEDQERTARFNAGRELATGSVRQPAYSVYGTPANNLPRARRPGEPDPRRVLGR